MSVENYALAPLVKQKLRELRVQDYTLKRCHEHMQILLKLGRASTTSQVAEAFRAESGLGFNYWWETQECYRILRKLHQAGFLIKFKEDHHLFWMIKDQDHQDMVSKWSVLEDFMIDLGINKDDYLLRLVRERKDACRKASATSD